jgi:tRNA-2-methylthio-N6-dimethylallyladenosine synthase
MQNKTFYIKTFGCQMNERDTEIIAQSLLGYGYIEALEMELSDVIIINTCSIRAKAEQKVMSLLGMLRKEKKSRPELKICVAGCVAQQEGGKLLERMPHVDLVVGTQNIYRIPKLLEGCDKDKRDVTSMTNSYEIPRFIPEVSGKSKMDVSIVPGPFKKFVTIMQGCNNFCTYCVVPYTRGREISRKKNDIIDEVKVLVDDGVREVTLLGQNVNSYGLANQVTEDGSPYSFPSLLEDIARISGLKRIRFTTSHPKDLSDDLMQCFRDIDILCNQIHLPVQAGSDAVLKKMNRKYTVAQYLKKVDALREYCPDIAITTDIIVGFPGETDGDFEKTIDLLERVRYDGSFSFKYSDRPGTKSTELQEKIAEEVKSQRLNRFQTRQDEISLEKNSAFIGKTLPVMVESMGAGGFQGRSEYNHVVHIETNISNKPGDIVPVFIYHAGQHSLQARIAEGV